MKILTLFAAAAIGLSAAAVVWSGDVIAQGRAGRSAQPAPSPGRTAFQTECSACHMLFPPNMLPARSWIALMDGLSKHFKENASLDDATAKLVEDFLVANSGDAPGQNPRYLRGLDRTATPLRITETPYWLREHRGMTEAALTRRGAKSAAQCQACHAGAAQGDFDS